MIANWKGFGSVILSLPPEARHRGVFAGGRGWVDLIEIILVYKLPRLTREELQRLLHLPDVELKQTLCYQDVFAEGRAEGQQQEAAALVLRLLRRRLGAVSGEMEKRIRALPLAELEALGEAVLDWHAPAELIAWLAAAGRTPVRVAPVRQGFCP